MQHVSLLKATAKPFIFAVLCLIFYGFSTRAGLDSYEIYLNQKLILKQYVNLPVNLQNFPLSNANANDQLVIYYAQCNAANKIANGRSIAVKDSQGNTVKEWKFADAKGGNAGMVIPVKELLQLQKNNTGSSFALYYTAEAHPESRLLTSFRIGGKPTAYQPAGTLPEPYGMQPADIICFRLWQTLL